MNHLTMKFNLGDEVWSAPSLADCKPQIERGTVESVHLDISQYPGDKAPRRSERYGMCIPLGTNWFSHSVRDAADVFRTREEAVARWVHLQASTAGGSS